MNHLKSSNCKCQTMAVTLTPAGRGAVAVVLVTGPHAVAAVQHSFSALNGRRLADMPIGRVVYGRWGGPAGEEVVVCRRPPSITANQQVEVHCHGGAAAVEAVLARLTECNVGVKSWHEWLQYDSETAQRTGHKSLGLSAQTSSAPTSTASSASATAAGMQSDRRGHSIQVAAQVALARATTARTAAVLLDQFHGALRSAVDAAMDALDAGNLRQAQEQVDALLELRDLGVHLARPWRVVVAGPPNVGKSSLINTLVGYQRAIVSGMPGTTRDIVTATTAIDGWPIEMSDTAGLCISADAIERAGMALARRVLAEADLVVLVAELPLSKGAASSKNTAGLPNLVWWEQQPVSATRVLRVTNKIDLSPSEFSSEQPLEIADVATSTVTGQGIDDLIAAIGASLVPVVPPPGAAVPFTSDQVDRLQSARNDMAAGRMAPARHALLALLA